MACRELDQRLREELTVKTPSVVLAALVLSVLTAAAVMADSNDPVEAVRGPVDRGLAVLKDPALQGKEHKQAQREKIWELVRDAFDFTEVAKRTLARNWLDFTPAERKAFTELFSELLGNTYLDKIQVEFSDETVEYSGMEAIDDTKVAVKTKIIRKAVQIPVDYSMMLKDGRWKAYDVYVEGISLVKNYRTQFAQILEKQKPAQLIERLRKKVADQKAGLGDSDLSANLPDGVDVKALQLKACSTLVNVAGGMPCQGPGSVINP
jgi:phospholipid transport system substrate-binding protein